MTNRARLPLPRSFSPLISLKATVRQQKTCLTKSTPWLSVPMRNPAESPKLTYLHLWAKLSSFSEDLLLLSLSAWNRHQLMGWPVNDKIINKTAWIYLIWRSAHTSLNPCQPLWAPYLWMKRARTTWKTSPMNHSAGIRTWPVLNSKSRPYEVHRVFIMPAMFLGWVCAQKPLAEDAISMAPLPTATGVCSWMARLFGGASLSKSAWSLTLVARPKFPLCRTYARASNATPLKDLFNAVTYLHQIS